VVREGYLGLKEAASEKPAGGAFAHRGLQGAQTARSLWPEPLSLPPGNRALSCSSAQLRLRAKIGDGNSPPSLMTDMFRILAERLAKWGPSPCCAYDERGVGESTGDYAAADLHDLLSDVEALLDYLAAHPEIDPQRLAMLGHSEGAYFGPPCLRSG